LRGRVKRGRHALQKKGIRRRAAYTREEGVDTLLRGRKRGHIKGGITVPEKDMFSRSSAKRKEGRGVSPHQRKVKRLTREKEGR